MCVLLYVYGGLYMIVLLRLNIFSWLVHAMHKLVLYFRLIQRLSHWFKLSTFDITEPVQYKRQLTLQLRLKSIQIHCIMTYRETQLY